MVKTRQHTTQLQRVNASSLKVLILKIRTYSPVKATVLLQSTQFLSFLNLELTEK